jgi:TRAP-type C4-dicarboxylate transport system permease small subunit
VLLTVAEIVRATINLVRPDWTLFRAVYSVFVHCGGLAVVYFLIKASSWVMAADSAPGEYARTAGIVNQIIYYALLITGIFSTVMLVVRVTRLIRGLRGQAGAAGVGAPAKQRN